MRENVKVPLPKNDKRDHKSKLGKVKQSKRNPKKKTLSNTFALFKVLLVLTNARLDYQIE